MDLDAQKLTLLGGLVVGAVFGATVQRTNYCMMGAVADFAISGDLRRLRAWMLTIAIAVIASQALHVAGTVDLSLTFYRQPSIAWGGALLGGLLFGFGMVIACGCASRSLVNFACGDLRALVALLFVAVVGYATMRGLLAYARLWLSEALHVDLAGAGLAGQGVPDLLSGGAEPGIAHVVGATALATVPLLVFALKDRAFLRERGYLAAALVLGLCIPAGWLVTGVLGADDFDPSPLVSLRFVAPSADSLQYLMTYTGARADFGVASVGGVLLGAFASAVAGGSFSLRGFEDLRELGNYMTGGALMGFGGVLALGCTVGQGLSGVSTLALGSFLALGAIVAGGVLGVRYLEQGSLAGAMRATLGGA